MTHAIIDSIIEEFEEYLDIETFTKVIETKGKTLNATLDVFQCYEEYRQRHASYELELARMRTREEFGMMWY